MKSPVFFKYEEFAAWCEKHSTFGDMKPTHYPCIVITANQDCLHEIVYYSEFQSARYVTNSKEAINEGTGRRNA